MKTTLSVCASIVLMGASLPALAEDENVETQHFEGWTIGLDLGVSDGGDFYSGLNLGYRWQQNNGLVYGLELIGGDYSTDDNRFGGLVVPEVDGVYSLNGFLGYAFGPSRKSLIYTTLGYAEAEFEIEGPGIDIAGPGLEFGFKEGGLRIGLGYERILSKSLSLRLQAAYEDYNSGFDPVVFTGGLAYRF